MQHELLGAKCYYGIEYSLHPYPNNNFCDINCYNNVSGDVIIPDSIKYQGISYAVRWISTDAFNGCSGMTSIHIPKTITSINPWAFYKCGGMKVYITDLTAWLNISIADYSASPLAGGRLYLNGEEVTSLTIPDEIIELHRNILRGCQSITNVTLHKNVQTIHNLAFCGCSNLERINIPKSVSKIGGGAFDGCHNLKKVYINDLYSWLYINFELNGNPCCNGATLYLNERELQNVTIPSSFTELKAYAFQGCNSITDINIPKSITAIGDGTFFRCQNLKNITIPNSVTRIGQNAFNGCANLSEITLQNSISTIETGTFANCTGLRKINIPNSVTSIGSSAFALCI